MFSTEVHSDLQADIIHYSSNLIDFIIDSIKLSTEDVFHKLTNLKPDKARGPFQPNRVLIHFHSLIKVIPIIIVI